MRAGNTTRGMFPCSAYLSLIAVLTILLDFSFRLCFSELVQTGVQKYLELFMKKYVGLSLRRVFVPVLAWFIAASASTTRAEIQSAQVLIQEVKGTASYSSGGSWLPLKQ